MKKVVLNWMLECDVVHKNVVVHWMNQRTLNEMNVAFNTCKREVGVAGRVDIKI